MHFKDDPISDIHAKNYLIILSLKHFPGPTKFGPRLLVPSFPARSRRIQLPVVPCFTHLV